MMDDEETEPRGAPWRSKKKRHKANPDTKKPTREKMWGRRIIISECRMPGHYIQETGKDAGEHKIKPGLLKAVLHEVAAFDRPGADTYPGNEYIEHNTQLSHGTVGLCIQALKQAKILRRSPGVHVTDNWIIDWDEVERRRIKFVPTRGKKVVLPYVGYEEEEDERARAEEDDEPAKPPKPASPAQPVAAAPEPITKAGQDPETEQLTDDLRARFAEHFDQAELARLPRLDCRKVISRLRHVNAVAAIRIAIEALDLSQLGYIIRADNPGAYLWQTLNNITVKKAKLASHQVQEAGESVAAPAPKPSGPKLPMPEEAGAGPATEDDKIQYFYNEAADVAKHFARLWLDDYSKPAPESSHLAPAFEVIPFNGRAQGNGFGNYMRFAIENDPHFRSVPLDQAARTFIKQLPDWILKYHKRYPGPIDPARYPED